MSVWNIYHKDGSLLKDANGKGVVVHELEYSDSWMGDCYLTISFKNEAPINFAIGDYILYRGEKFELNYDPGKNKQASKNTYGEGFVYDSVKFNALQDELVRTEFLDVVLNDNQLHYTALPKFSFYVETLDDLLDRIQANINEQIGEGVWNIYSRSLERSKQRGCTEEGWNKVYGKGTSAPASIDSKSISVDTKNCWEALALVNSEWDINFIVKGRNICVETVGVPTKNIFKYGLGNGLYEVDQNAESDQSVVTRLRAYGSEKNLPSFYYADLGTKYKANVTHIVPNVPELRIGLDLAYVATYFKVPRQISTTENTDTGYVVEVTFDFVTYVTCTVLGATTGKCVLFVVNGSDKSMGYEPSLENINKFKAQLSDGQTKLYFSSGINTKIIPNENKEYAENLPNNMACNRLMLPGFPHLSLKEYWDTLSAKEKEYVNPSGKEHVFSDDKYRPYIDSVNISKIGLRSASKFFDQDDKNNGIIDIYPTIEEMVVDGHRVDAIYKGSNIEDNGRFEDNQTVNNFDVYLDPAIDFNINDLRENDFAVNMKDGMCGGRTFSVAAASKTGNSWKLTLKRTKDDALELWFPYKDYQINKGDHFVLTGITMPDQYVRAASLKLLKYAIAFLDKNDYTRYVYQPKIDEIFMARQHDEAMADKTGAITSLHDTLKAGDLMQFEEEDFGIKETITIDKLTIKEANGSIPTYDITLREDKEVGTIKKIQNQINSLVSSNGANTTATMNQLRNLIPQEGAKYFASKLYKDRVQDTLTFDKFQVFLSGLEAQGIIVANNGVDLDKDGTHYLDGAGNGALADVVVDRLHDKDSTPADRVIVGAQGFDLYMGTDGKSHLYVDYLTTRTKMFASSLEIRKVSYSGGTTIFSNAGSQICKVSYMWSEDNASVIAYKCYSVADDGTTKTMNWWHVGMMALCQTFNVKAGETSNAANRYYWRMVVGVGQEKLEDGKLYDYVILSNQRVFQGNAAVIPSFTQGLLGTDKPLVFGNVMVQVVNKNGMKTMAELFQEQEGKTTDDGGTKIASRLFYGYESVDGGDEQEPDAPQPWDVIVQVGDQIQWKKYGNLIKLSTSVEDNATENAPAITMYHNLGAPYSTGNKDAEGNDIISPFQWKTITTVISPERVMHNADNFLLFQGTPDNIVSPIVISYDIIPSTTYITRHPATNTTTPTDISFSLQKRTGNKTEYISDAKIYADYTDAEGVEHTNVLLANNKLSDLGSVYGITSATIHTTITTKDQEDELVTFDLPVLTDGVKGEPGIPGTNGSDGSTTYFHIKYSSVANPTSASQMTETPSTYIGTYVDFTKEDSNDPKKYTWARFQGIQGDKGEQGIPGVNGIDGVTSYLHIKYSDDGGKTFTSNSGETVGAYIGTCVDNNIDDPTTVDAYTWAKIKGTDGKNGKDGTNGTNGEDAINIEIIGAPMVFDTADDGIVPSGDSHTAEIRVYQKGVNQSAKIKNASILKSKCVNLDTATFEDGKTLVNMSNYLSLTLTGNNIAKDTIDGTTDQVSKATGYAVVQFSYDGVMYQRQIVFNVNVAKYTHTLKQTSKQLESKYTEVSKSVTSLADDLEQTNDSLTEVGNMANRTDEDYRKFESTFEQNAREIAMEVTSETVGRRNLLLGSDFRRQGDFGFNGDTGIEILSGYRGINCIHAISKSKDVYAGVYWQANTTITSVKNIPITAGKSYTFSCWVKCSSTTAQIKLSMVYAASVGATTFDGGEIPTKDNAATLFNVKAADEWELINVTFTPTGSAYPYAAAAVWMNSRSEESAEAYFCMPMLEESESVNPWTLHPQDYDFVAGNMLDNTRWLSESISNNPSFAATAKYTDYDSGRQAVFQNVYTYNQRAMYIDTTGMKAGQDYILSFLCQGNVNCQVAATYSNKVVNYVCEDCRGNIIRTKEDEASRKTIVMTTIANIRNDTYERLWAHLRFIDSVPANIQLIIKKGTIYIAQPKLEESCRMTEWTERKSDLVDENRLRKTGISIIDGTITLRADNTIISGDLHLRGVLVENCEEVLLDTNAEVQKPVVCDLVAHKSVAVNTCNLDDTLSANHQRQVLLPMINDVEVDRYKTGSYNIQGVRESGVKLTIMSKYNPNVAQWKYGTPQNWRYIPRSAGTTDKADTIQEYLSNVLVAVFADPRLARCSNWKEEADPTNPVNEHYYLWPESYNDSGYRGGCFVCNGRRGRILLLMPGQSVSLTSSVETINDEEVLLWYVDNASEFVSIHHKFLMQSDYDADIQNSFTLDYSGSENWPSELASHHYQDAIFAPPELDWDYPKDGDGATDQVELPIVINLD